VLLAPEKRGELKTKYLVAIHHPDDYDPSREDEAASAVS
jgi:hypothetical protein